MENSDDLTYSMEDHQDIGQDGCEPQSRSLFLSVFSAQARLNGSKALGLSLPLVQEIIEESECSGAAQQTFAGANASTRWISLFCC